MPSGRASRDLGAAEQMIAYVRGLIEKGALRPDDRLAPERELVRQIGVSRTSVHERRGDRQVLRPGPRGARSGRRSGASLLQTPRAGRVRGGWPGDSVVEEERRPAA